MTQEHLNTEVSKLLIFHERRPAERNWQALKCHYVYDGLIGHFQCWYRDAGAGLEVLGAAFTPGVDL